MKSIFTLLLITFSLGLLAAQEAEGGVSDAQFESALGIEFDGLVLDQTRTRAGREFYEQFYAKWTASGASTGGFDILLEESPARGLFGFLEIKVNDTALAAYHLQPGEEWLETAVQEAVERLLNYFQNIEQLQRDLESQDQAGSGIY